MDFAKSELIPVNIDTHHAEHRASLLGCQTGSLPFTYLGLPIHWKKANKKFWNDLYDQISARGVGKVIFCQ